jgi:hypothetical protein
MIKISKIFILCSYLVYIYLVHIYFIFIIYMQLNNFNLDENKSNQKNIINIGNSLETTDNATQIANQVTTQTVSQDGGGRAPSSLIQLAISSIPPVNPRFFDLMNGIVDNTVPVPANELVPQLLQRVGGGEDKYKMKYLKYKQKYIDLKNQLFMRNR